MNVSSMLAALFDLDQYTSAWTTLQAAEYFWVGFALAVAGAAFGLWTLRPHQRQHHR
jgi:hypothetical protein